MEEAAVSRRFRKLEPAVKIQAVPSIIFQDERGPASGTRKKPCRIFYTTAPQLLLCIMTPVFS